MVHHSHGSPGSIRASYPCLVPSATTLSGLNCKHAVCLDLATTRWALPETHGHMFKLLSPGYNLLRRTVPKDHVPHVCVVGAGMAGLRCAEVLIKNGIKVTIVEGRDRIGGRVHQQKLRDRLVDMGPNWIHGTENNPILHLAQETKSALHQLHHDKQCDIGADGNALDGAVAKKWQNLISSILVAAHGHSDRNWQSIPPNESLFDYFQSSIRSLLDNPSEAVDKVVPAATDSAADREQQLLWMADYWSFIIGDTMQRQSLKFFWLEEGIDGSDLFVASTYKAILDRVAELPLAKADVQLSRKVTSIESGSEGTLVEIKTADGKSQKFDEVVLTAPLGWLKRNKEAFIPALPLRLAQAIDSVSYGRLEKIYITFPSAFWHDASSGTESSNSPSSDSLDDDDDDAEESPGPSSALWMHPLYDPDHNPESWTQEAVSLAMLRPPHSQPTLLFYTYGACSEHIASLASSHPTTSSHLSALDPFFKPYYSRLPGYSPTSADCVPTDILATSWTRDELAGYGSYSNFQVGLTAADVDVETMREGMPERGVWLAGEHTAPFIASGTVTGAYWSGEGVAQRILQAYGRTRCDEVTFDFVKGRACRGGWVGWKGRMERCEKGHGQG